MKRWCPNCHFFYKKLGMNYCHLADGNEGYLEGGYDPQARTWLQQNQRADSSIYTEADHCPRFIPYPLLVQRQWFERNNSAGQDMTDGQLYWLRRRHGAE